jgi:hypothetical protein
VAAAELWKCPSGISKVSFVAESQSATNWNGTGSGDVVVAFSATNVIVFTESGVWQPMGGRPTRFTNVYRWTNLNNAQIRLEHWRLGPENPVHLFDLGVREDGILVPHGPHLCKEDCYSAQLNLCVKRLRPSLDNHRPTEE